MSLRIGVDLGGTKAEAVVVRLLPAGQPPAVLARLRRPTQRDRGYEALVELVAQLILDVAQQAGLSAANLPPVGVGMPGGITRAGVVKNSNTTCLNGRMFRQDLRARLRHEVVFANDANCFALAEAVFGAGRGHRLVFGVILGTGVGGGIVCTSPEGRSATWDGPQGIAGEWGHVSLDPQAGLSCYCGRRGCVETYLSGPALAARYVALGGAPQPLVELAKTPDDPRFQDVMTEAAGYFGRALATVLNILDPDVVVLGGGVSKLPMFYEAGRREVQRWIFSDELTTPIVQHQIGDSAGVLGAALLPT